ncbi:MAG: DNA alkylation repair protein [Calditrichaeota bacterium]|nr:DNA alkylation repair protein [Calditrichota bacterium]
MTKTDVIKLLSENRNERGMVNWEKSPIIRGFTSYGIGLTQLKKLAKQVGKNHELAMELWHETNYDAKILAILIDEAKQVTREQVDRQVAELTPWSLTHVYCSTLLPKVGFLVPLAEDWMTNSDSLKRSCGFQLLYQIAKNDKKLPDDYFLPYIERIERELQTEENFVKDGMNSALLMIGQRSKPLYERSVAAARAIGKVTVDYGDNSCQAMDVLAHLTGDRIRKKFLA